MRNKLKEHFPMIRDREELEKMIRENQKLSTIFAGWEEERRKEFLDFCTGNRGIKVLYDPFFKEVMNPEYDSKRLEYFLYVFLKRKVKILQVLPNDSTRIADEMSLLITDIIVELEDGSIANVEIQKIGYHFPGQRSACYSADMLLRQYKRIRSKQGKKFSYSQIKSVYSIIIYEQSPKEFKAYRNEYIHHSKQVFDTGLQLNLLQEFVMVPLDIFYTNMQNKSIETESEAWLSFLAYDEPDRIIELITKYPMFKPLYETLYQMCRNVEDVMGFFSEELRILDRNTVKYMIEEQEKQLEEQEKQLEEQEKQLEEQEKQLGEVVTQLEEQKKQLKNVEMQLNEQRNLTEQKDIQIKRLEEQVEVLLKQLER